MVANKVSFNILVIEDNPGDFALVEEFLIGEIEIGILTRAKTFKEAKIILSSGRSDFDIVLLDLSLPDKTGIPLIKEIVAFCITTPVIVLTGYSDIDFGIKSLSLGISDYLLKDELTAMSLYKSILYSTERKKVASALEESEKKYSELFHMSPQPMWVFDLDTLYFLNVNNAAIKHYGYSHEEFLSMTILDIRPISELPKMEKALKLCYGQEQLICQGNFTHRKRNGEIIQVDIQSNIIQYKGKNAMVILAIDVTERLNYIKAIEAQNEKLREISWIQSHIVRAPLARIMGLIQLFKDIDEEDEKEQMLDYVLISANELDEVIKGITDITKVAEDEKYQKNGLLLQYAENEE